MANGLSNCGRWAQEFQLEGLAASLACGILVPTAGIESASPKPLDHHGSPNGEVLNLISLCFLGRFRWDRGAYAESVCIP